MPPPGLEPLDGSLAGVDVSVGVVSVFGTAAVLTFSTFGAFFVGLKMSCLSPSGLRFCFAAGSSSETIGSVASDAVTLSAATLAAGLAGGSVAAGSFARTNGTAAIAPTSRSATGQSRRRTSWRQRSVIGFIGALQ